MDTLATRIAASKMAAPSARDKIADTSEDKKKTGTSRALQERRRNDTPDFQKRVEEMMASTGCSEPVARNLLKYAKLGIGPMATSGASASSSRPPDGFRDDSKLENMAAASMAEKKRRLREQEARLREQEDRLQEMEDQREKDQELQQKLRKRTGTINFGGIQRLGPVMAREEKVDPFVGIEVSKDKAAAPEEEEEDDAGAKEAEAKSSTVSGTSGGTWSTGPPPGALAARLFEGEGRKDKKKHGKRTEDEKKKKRKRRDDSADSSGSSARRKARQSKASGSAAAASSVIAKKSEAASDSGDEAPKQRPPGGLMSEAEIIKMMGKDKQEAKSERGTLRAKRRIQQEMKEWEKNKQANAEYWKAPKFCLCFSAETTKNRGY